MADMQDLLEFPEGEINLNNQTDQDQKEAPNDENITDKIEEQISRIVNDSPQLENETEKISEETKNSNIEASLESLLGMSSEPQHEDNQIKPDENSSAENGMFEENDIENILSSPPRPADNTIEEIEHKEPQKSEENITESNELTETNDRCNNLSETEQVDNVNLEESCEEMTTDSKENSEVINEKNQQPSDENLEEVPMEIDGLVATTEKTKSVYSATPLENKCRLLMKENDSLKRSNAELIRLNRKYRQQIGRAHV